MTALPRGARRPSSRRLGARLRRFPGDARGSVTVQNMVWMATLLAASGFAIDTANAFRTKAMLQAAADSAALAAVIDLPDEAAARRTAQAFADLNLPAERHGDVLGVADVQFGTWEDGVFRPGQAPADTVRVEVGRTTGRGNPLPTLLLKLAGKTEFEIEVDAVARRGSVGSTVEAPCAAGGFAAGGEATLGSGNLAPDGWCLHGETVLEIGGDNLFEIGAAMSVENEENFYEGFGNAGAEEARFQQSLSVSLPDLALHLDNVLRGGTSELPDYIGRGPYVTERLPELVLGNALYLVTGPVEIPAGTELRDVAIHATGDIVIGDGSVLNNVVLVATGGVSFGSSVVLGPESVCDDGVVSVYAFADGNIDFGRDVRLRGVQLASRVNLDLGSGPSEALAVYGEARADVLLPSDVVFEGCPAPLESHWPESTWAPLVKQTVATSLTR